LWIKIILNILFYFILFLKKGKKKVNDCATCTTCMVPRRLLKNKTTKGVSHCGLATYIKTYLKAKEELWKLKYFTMQKYNLQKNPLKETKILQDIITL
jgi:hypothetical protein